MSSKPLNHAQAATLLCFLGYSGVVYSATATSNFTVSATVVNDCVISANPLAFPNYSPTSGTETTGNTTISVTCTSGAMYNIGLNEGLGAGATVTTRKMTRTAGGGQTLDYSLYKDPACTNVWGNTGLEMAQGTGEGIPQLFTVYGKIPSSQAVPAALYTDTIALTVTY